MQPLVVVAPAVIGRLLATLGRCYAPLPFQFVFLDVGAGPALLPHLAAVCPAAAYLAAVTTVPVIHCRDAFAVCLVLRSGIKIVYSGDTRPCARCVRLNVECFIVDSMHSQSPKKAGTLSTPRVVPLP